MFSQAGGANGSNPGFANVSKQFMQYKTSAEIIEDIRQEVKLSTAARLTGFLWWVMVFTLSEAIRQSERLFDFSTVWASVLYHWSVPLALYILAYITSTYNLHNLKKHEHELELALARRAEASHGSGDPYLKHQGVNTDVYTVNPKTLSARYPHPTAASTTSRY